VVCKITKNAFGKYVYAKSEPNFFSCQIGICYHSPENPLRQEPNDIRTHFHSIPPNKSLVWNIFLVTPSVTGCLKASSINTSHKPFNYKGWKKLHAQESHTFLILIKNYE